MEWLNIVPGVVTSIVGAFLIFLGNQLLNRLKVFNEQHEGLVELKSRFEELEADYSLTHEALIDSQRTQIKNTLVHVYNTSKEKGYILATELEVANRLADCYYKLGGNSYIHILMKHLNADAEIKIVGEIPEY